MDNNIGIHKHTSQYDAIVSVIRGVRGPKTELVRRAWRLIGPGGGPNR
jgi:hypothetical protein